LDTPFLRNRLRKPEGGHNQVFATGRLDRAIVERDREAAGGFERLGFFIEAFQVDISANGSPSLLALNSK
jgi:hypothetical protein